MKPVLLFCLVLTATIGYSQNYLGEIQVPKVSKDGFYRISITPKVAGFLSTDFTNLRVVDKAGKEIPYLVREEIPVRYNKKFQEYELEKRKTRTVTELVLKNPERKAINNIYLKIKNADVIKEAKLLGSDDRKDWFAIKEKFNLYPIDGGNGTFEMKVLDFPMSNYLFYSLRISDSLTAPINILNAGYYEANIENGQYEEVPGKVKWINDTKKKSSSIKFSFDTIQIVDRVELKLKGEQKYFLRKAVLEETRERKLKKGKAEKYQVTIAGFEVSSTLPTQLDIAGSRLKDFQIVIDNEDNPPLELVSLKTFQLNRYVIAWLSSHDEYLLKIGNEKLPAPSYDLHFFSDSIPKQIDGLMVGDITVYEKPMAPSGTSFFNSKNFIWAAILIVALLLGYMAMKLVKDMGKSTSK